MKMIIVTNVLPYPPETFSNALYGQLVPPVYLEVYFSDGIQILRQIISKYNRGILRVGIISMWNLLPTVYIYYIIIYIGIL